MLTEQGSRRSKIQGESTSLVYVYIRLDRTRLVMRSASAQICIDQQVIMTAGYGDMVISRRPVTSRS